MNQEDQSNRSLRKYLFTEDGKPLRVLSTSLGIALLANVLILPMESGIAAGTSSASGPKLVEWSSEEVKKYYDAEMDWNIPELNKGKEEEEEEESAGGAAAGGSSSSSSSGTTIVHTTSGFGWDDLLLYHMIFNRGSTYSSSGWYSSHTAYDVRSGKSYRPRSYTSDTFQNKPVSGSAITPKTSRSTGSIIKRSTSSPKGSIGGKSSGFSSSSSSSGSHSSGGFGG